MYWLFSFIRNNIPVLIVGIFLVKTLSEIYQGNIFSVENKALFININQLIQLIVILICRYIAQPSCCTQRTHRYLCSVLRLSAVIQFACISSSVNLIHLLISQAVQSLQLLLKTYFCFSVFRAQDSRDTQYTVIN